VGVVALLQWQYSALPVVVGFAGACALLYGSLLLIREARLAVRSTLQEVSFAREAALGSSEQRVETETLSHKIRRKNDSLFYATHMKEIRFDTDWRMGSVLIVWLAWLLQKFFQLKSEIRSSKSETNSETTKS
jgi:hypothetical protein